MKPSNLEESAKTQRESKMKKSGLRMPLTLLNKIQNKILKGDADQLQFRQINLGRINLIDQIATLRQLRSATVLKWRDCFFRNNELIAEECQCPEQTVHIVGKLTDLGNSCSTTEIQTATKEILESKSLNVSS